ncbi:hypothetical protein E2C01_033886 [Portunus trituberculatus]|uniref:Endonuclease/exonuclease/phosphatase domain-containing protein n=1 Tax=Portunus trituberculatus TaxID=210409 RepID=A0A5B7EZ32_PORTR|nr:hypothetical protein [Portunus trituberculatus]
MATPNPVLESPSGEETRNFPRSDCSLVDDPKCFDTSLNFFFINFCNIHGLRSNFQSIEHLLSSIKPHLLFFTETQLPEASDSSPFSVPSYFLYPHFSSKAGCCVYVRNDLTYSRAHAFESSEFSTIWPYLHLSTVQAIDQTRRHITKEEDSYCKTAGVSFSLGLFSDAAVVTCSVLFSSNPRPATRPSFFFFLSPFLPSTDLFYLFSIFSVISSYTKCCFIFYFLFSFFLLIVFRLPSPEYFFPPLLLHSFTAHAPPPPLVPHLLTLSPFHLSSIAPLLLSRNFPFLFLLFFHLLLLFFPFFPY